MSSHHVVREKQEPALLALGLDTFDEELLGQLLEWSPTVIATSHTAEKLNAFGIKIDWLISDEEMTAPQLDIKLLPAGNDTPAEAALKHLVTYNYPAVNIITDDLELKDFMFFTGKIGLVVYHQNKKIYPVNSGFSKWKPAGEVIALLQHATAIHTGGLEPIGNHHYRVVHDGFISLEFDQPFIFIAEEI